MPVLTFTVPSTGTFVSATTGGRFKYTEGDVIALDLALDLQMEGAEAPDPESALTTAQQTAVDAAISAAIGAVTLGDLGDVTLTDPQADDALTFNGSAWVNTAAE